MHYISTLALAILTAATLTSAITPDSVISTLNSLEARTGTLETLASSLNTASCITGGPYIDILEGLDTMTTKIKSLNQNLDGSEPLKSNVADAQFANEIMSGYHEFVKAQAAFLKNLSGKAKVCKTLMLGGQMVPFLEGARTVLDTLGIRLIEYTVFETTNIAIASFLLETIYDIIIAEYKGGLV